jgi:hypothetical protein
MSLQKAWHQTVMLIEKHITKMGIGPLCKLFGKSRQTFYDKNIIPL